jgi:hypothetical protein
MFDLVRDPTEQHNLLFDPSTANLPENVRLFSDLKSELAKLQRQYQDEGQYADPNTWPSDSADGPFGDKKPLGNKSIPEAIALATLSAARR